MHQGTRASGHLCIREPMHPGTQAPVHQGTRASSHPCIWAPVHLGTCASGHPGTHALKQQQQADLMEDFSVPDSENKAKQDPSLDPKVS